MLQLQNLQEAQRMLDAFASVGARHFDVTFLNIEGKKRGFRPEQSVRQVQHPLAKLFSGLRHHQVPKADAVRAFALRMLILSVLALWANHAFAQDVPQSISQALASLDSREYWVGIVSMTSSTAVVKKEILDSPQGKVLSQHCADAVPKIVTNLSSGKLHEQASAIAYFVVLEACKDPRALPAIADYLESLAYTNDFKALQLTYSLAISAKTQQCAGYDHTHAFLYALDALRSLGVETPSKSSCYFFEERHKVSQAARALARARLGANK